LRTYPNTRGYSCRYMRVNRSCSALSAIAPLTCSCPRNVGCSGILTGVLRISDQTPPRGRPTGSWLEERRTGEFR
jgi:hypothetical protein